MSTKKPSKAKAPKAKAKKPVKKAVAKKTASDKPSLESILDEADLAFTDIVKKYLKLGEALVKAETFYGTEGKKAFRMRFPLTDNAIRNLEYVGRGNLLPQFAMCSNRFVKGLVDMTDSLTWQYKLLGASQNGYIRVRINGNIVDAKFTDLKEGTIDGVLSIISDADKDLTPEQLCDKLKKLNREVRSKFSKENRPDFEIKDKDGVKTVKFYKAKPYTAGELKKILEKMEG